MKKARRWVPGRLAGRRCWCGRRRLGLGQVEDGLVLEREVAGGDLALVVGEELGDVVAALGELCPRASRVEAAARRRIDRRRDVALEDDPLLLRGEVRVRDRDRREQRARVGVL